MDGNTLIHSAELLHYGVKGMKWGVHKLKRYTSPTRQNVKQILMAVPRGVASAVIPGYPEVHNALVIRDMINNLDKKDYFKKEGYPEKLSELKKKSAPTPTTDDMKRVNPRIGQSKGTVKNCGLCTAAMEMRARGYDVRARKKANGITENEIKSWFNGAKIEHPKIERMPKESRKSFVNRSYDNLCNQIEKFGNGSRGYVGVQYEKVGSGHAMYWTVSEGRVNFYDGQNKKSNVQVDKVFALADPTKHSFARLDNCKENTRVTEAVISVDYKKRSE